MYRLLQQINCYPRYELLDSSDGSPLSDNGR